jgi:hypothetical protein
MDLAEFQARAERLIDNTAKEIRLLGIELPEAPNMSDIVKVLQSRTAFYAAGSRALAQAPKMNEFDSLLEGLSAGVHALALTFGMKSLPVRFDLVPQG